MRAQTINFERGGDPKRRMRIGRRFFQIAEESGMTPAELRLTASRLSNLFINSGFETSLDTFSYWLEKWREDPAEYEIDKNSPLYDDIVWASNNPKSALELIHINPEEMYESQNFERGGDPMDRMGLGVKKEFFKLFPKFLQDEERVEKDKFDTFSRIKRIIYDRGTEITYLGIYYKTNKVIVKLKPNPLNYFFFKMFDVFIGNFSPRTMWVLKITEDTMEIHVPELKELIDNRFIKTS